VKAYRQHPAFSRPRFTRVTIGVEAISKLPALVCHSRSRLVCKDFWYKGGHLQESRHSIGALAVAK
jgi:hypothetical protein